MLTGKGIRMVQALGIASSAFLSGTMISTSIIAAPALLTPSMFYSSNHLALQWRNLYMRGSRVGPPITLLASSAYLFIAYTLFGNSNARSLAQLYAIAGALTFGVVPYTMFAMKPTNDTLILKAIDGPVQEPLSKTGETEDLVERWITKNLIRGLIALGGTAVGLYATLV
ncbi:hypothetical protein E1B28_008224 [Marasmius oreades]|uniref:DUF1772-domain-containing protein n=1 Tax=Marasmius oreades TaxID=181124 RepID=A0A9P7RZ51_9AGAR|nr:uncharacterized protein E1B28_008224 [Marasmius oreades]KAG7091821.1 hypothetical protein E1B28_008224 [Marasmius oreades]